MRITIASLIKAKHRLQDPLYKNSIILVGISGLNAILGFVFWIVAARFYSPTEVGLASALIAAASLLCLLSNLGFPVGLIRFLSRARDKIGMLNTSLTIAGTFSLVVAAVFVVGLPLWSPALLFLQENVTLLIAFIVFTVAVTLNLIQKSAFIALRSTGFLLLREIVWGILKIGLVIALVILGVLGIFSSWGVAMWLGLALGILFIMRVMPGFRPLPTIRKNVANDMLHFSAVSYVADLAGSISNYILPLLVVNTLGAEANAYFYIAFAIAMALFMIPVGVMTSLFAEGSHDPEKLRGNTIRATKFVLILLIPAMAVLLLFGDKILSIFGRVYSENALHLLWLLTLSAIPLAVNELYIAVKRVQLQVKDTAYIYWAIATLVIGISYVLSARIGLIGVGLGWIMGHTLVASALLGTSMIGKWRRRGGDSCQKDVRVST